MGLLLLIQYFEMKKQGLKYFLKPFNAYDFLILGIQKAQDLKIAEVSNQEGFTLPSGIFVKKQLRSAIFSWTLIFFSVYVAINSF